ncbi:MAG: ferrous iron transport protein A [Anaerolineae bacterium]|nr:ferrous iron transport protein A [Anaerolineae bacterium]
MIDHQVQTKTLDQLPIKAVATVTALTNKGAERRRMMDLGILPGLKIEVEMKNPLGDPTAYRIRGAVIALRQEQASCIQITIDEENE